MGDEPKQPTTYDFYRFFVETAERATDRRESANKWMLSVNAAVSGLYGYLKAGGSVPNDGTKQLWMLAIPAAGMIIAVAWAALVRSYKELNKAKFKVIDELEADLAEKPYRREYEHYIRDRKLAFSDIELLVPVAFFLLYLFFMIVQIVAYVSG